jgi:hypothetical protein
LGWASTRPLQARQRLLCSARCASGTGDCRTCKGCGGKDPSGWTLGVAHVNHLLKPSAPHPAPPSPARATAARTALQLQQGPLHRAGCTATACGCSLTRTPPACNQHTAASSAGMRSPCLPRMGLCSTWSRSCAHSPRSVPRRARHHSHHSMGESTTCALPLLRSGGCARSRPAAPWGTA